MKHKNIFILMITIIFCMICTSCGSGQGGEKKDASGSSVSADSASGMAAPDDVVEKLDIELEKKQQHFFANKTSYFMEVRNEKDIGTGFDQIIKTDSERIQFRPKRFLALLGVTDEGVYYAKEKGGSADPDNAVLYRIPFGKGKSGKTRLEEDQEELIMEEPNGFQLDKAAYIDDRYIVYLPNMECVIKYDRKSKEKVELQMESGGGSIVAVGEDALILADLMTNDEFLYRLDLKSDKIEKIWEDKDKLLDDVMLTHSGYLFCVRGDEVWAYDVEKKKREKLLSHEQLLSACGQASDLTGGQKAKNAYVENLFCCKGRLYMQIQIDWKSGKDERMGYAMFSMDLTGGERELVYDVSLSVCMRSRSTEQTHRINPNIKWNSGRCHDITEDGKVILILNRKDIVEQQVGYYNIASREFKLIGEDDIEYSISYVDTKKAFGANDFELEKSYMAVMPDDLY